MTTVTLPRPAAAAVDLHAAAVMTPFTLLCAYALLRWQTMLPHLGWRPLALLGVSVVTVVLVSGPSPTRRYWPDSDPRAARLVDAALAVVLGAVLAALVLLIAGIPLGWITGVRVALVGRTLGDGVAAIPGVTVPYHGSDHAVRIMITAVGGLLVVSAALSLGGVLNRSSAGGPGAGQQPPANTGEAAVAAGRQHRLILAAALLLVMSLVPSVVVEPQYALLHGAIAFVLCVLLVVGWRIERGRGLGAVLLLTLTAAGGTIAVAAIAPRHGLLAVNRIVSSLGPAKPATFDWQQTYGPLGRLGTDQVVLTVRARHPAHWKAEDLDRFTGTHWTTGIPQAALGPDPVSPLIGVSRRSRARWTQTLHITDVDVTTSTLIAAGSAAMPLIDRAIPGAIEGDAPGTWILENPLTPGVTYSVTVYTPRPTGTELSSAGTRYPRAIRETDLGVGSARRTAAETALAPVAALARRLRDGSGDPYRFALAVEHYLRHGFTYVRNPPRSADPIPAFLFHTHRGYCQQFAGAMALLLRMGGVPARVAVGFATGSHARGGDTYLVRANDAHAWVEVWFPHYGWVTFDPTPGSVAAGGATGTTAPAGNPHSSQPIRGSRFPSQHNLHSTVSRQTPAARTRHQAAAGGLPVLTTVIVAVLALLAAGIAIVVRGRSRTRRVPGAAEMTRELERAFAGCGRPLAPQVTLAEIERSLERTSPEAAGYVRAVRLSRFRSDTPLPPPGGRRAVRAWLASGRGLRGHLRALIVMPPRWRGDGPAAESGSAARTM